MSKLKNNGRVCAQCKHCFEGYCRRYPPTVSIVMQMRPGTVATGGQPIPTPSPVSAFPPVGDADDMWCGEWEGADRVLKLQ